MAAIPPNTNLDGFIASMKQGVEGVFNKGVKYGRYLEQQERPRLVRCRNCEFAAPDPIGREGVLFCYEWERFTQGDGYCHKSSRKDDGNERSDRSVCAADDAH